MVISELENYRKDAIEAAIDLTYSQDTVYNIERATTITQIGNIMKQARINSINLGIAYKIIRKNNKVSNEKN